MKIVIDALSARVGGGQTYLKNLLAHLPEQLDLDIVVYAPAYLQLPSDRRIRRRIITWLPENPLIRAMWQILALPRIIVREKAQILFCPGGIVITRVPVGCKTVATFQNLLPFDPVATARVPHGLQRIRLFLLNQVMLHSMRRADLTIFISDYARHVIEALTPVRKAVTIPHGISDAFRTHTKTLPRPAWLPKGEYLLYVSLFDVYKHQFEVAAAFAALPADLVTQYTLLLVGKTDKVLTRRVTDLARNRGLENQIRVTGPIAYADLPAAYHHATVNLFASSCENCPNILLEALGAGRPVLSSDVMPMPEFGVDAVEYCSPTNPNSIRDALVRLLRDGALRSRLAAAAARRSADFDWARTARMSWGHITGLVMSDPGGGQGE